MPRAVYIVFGALFTAAVSYALGRMLLHRLRLRLTRQEGVLFAFLSGAALLHLLVFATLATGIARKGVFLWIGIGVLVAAWRGGHLRRPEGAAAEPLPGIWRWTFRAVYGAYTFLYLSNAMAPEMSPDGSAYHLGLVARYLREHRFGGITTNMYANLTQGIEMLYTFAFAFGRHSAASLLHCLFTLSLPWLLAAYARRFGFPVAGVGGALLLFCAPLTGIDGTTAYIDMAVVAVVFAVFYLAAIWRTEAQDGLVPLIGLMAGYCFAIKYTAALAIPAAGLSLLILLLRRRRPWLRPMLVFSGCVLLMAVPWAAKNWITVGNPLSPFFNRYFPNPNVFISFEMEYLEMMRHYGDVTDYSVIPLDLTVRGARLSGMLGPVFLLAPLALLAVRFPEGRWLLGAAVVFGLPYINNIGARFLLPALPFVCLSLALAVARSRGVLLFLVILHAVLSWPHVLRRYCSPHAWTLQRIPVAAALRISPEERYLTQRFPGYLIARMVEDFVPPGGSVFTFNGIPEAYTNRDVRVAYQSGSNNNLGEVIWAALFADHGPVGRMTYEFPATAVERIRLHQAPAMPGEWVAYETRFFHRGVEIPRQPSWRIRGWPNPWDAGRAFDNSPVTRWRPRQPQTPNEFLEAGFPAPTVVDRVCLDISRDYPPPALHIYGAGADGQWRRLAASGKHEDIGLPRGLRGAAMDELRRHGIGYLLVNSGDPGDQDFKQNGRLWGITLLAERAWARLYRIEEVRQ